MTDSTTTPSRPGGGVTVRRKVETRRPDLDTVWSINPDGSRNFVYPHDVRGRFQVLKRVLWTVLIGIYVLLPWGMVDGKPMLMLDIPNREFHAFGTTFNASDFYLSFFLITGVGFTLFLVSALWGRLWCGFGCPQTVFLEGVYRRVERWIEGPATKRIALARAPWTTGKLVKRIAKHAAFAVISIALTHTFLGYFMPVRELVHAVTQSPAAHPTAFTFALVSTLILYGNFAWFREQLCIVICPYGRYQGTLYDRDTVVVGYDTQRGEPRGPRRKGQSENAEGEALGDCIDCYRCVSVCPTGIDIRNGTQLECIGCTNCIDACDEVMDRIGKPRGLIRFDSQAGLEGGKRRFWRPRVFVYGFLFLLGCTVFTIAASRRVPFEAAMLRDPGPPYEIVDGVIHNRFRLRLINKLGETRTFTVRGDASAAVDLRIPADRVELDPMEKAELVVLSLIPRAEWDRDVAAHVEVVALPEAGEETEEAVSRRLAVPLSGPR